MWYLQRNIFSVAIFPSMAISYLFHFTALCLNRLTRIFHTTVGVKLSKSVDSQNSHDPLWQTTLVGKWGQHFNEIHYLITEYVNLDRGITVLVGITSSSQILLHTLPAFSPIAVGLHPISWLPLHCSRYTSLLADFPKLPVRTRI